MTRLFICLLWLWAFQAQGSEPVILVLGDSLSAAYGIGAEQGWPALLEERLQRDGYAYRVVNASISGDTSASGLSRLPAALEQHRPAVLILELGANDGLRGLSPDQIEHNLIAMIEMARSQGVRVLLAGMRLPPNYGPTYTHRFRDLYSNLARRYQVSLIPFLLDGVAARPELMQADGLHPTAKAQPLVLENVWRYLLPLLRER
jgi:acyl-CoA thioesterase-1